MPAACQVTFPACACSLCCRLLPSACSSCLRCEPEDTCRQGQQHSYLVFTHPRLCYAQKGHNVCNTLPCHASFMRRACVNSCARLLMKHVGSFCHGHEHLNVCTCVLCRWRVRMTPKWVRRWCVGALAYTTLLVRQAGNLCLALRTRLWWFLAASGWVTGALVNVWVTGALVNLWVTGALVNVWVTGALVNLWVTGALVHVWATGALVHVCLMCGQTVPAVSRVCTLSIVFACFHADVWCAELQLCSTRKMEDLPPVSNKAAWAGDNTCN